MTCPVFGVHYSGLAEEDGIAIQAKDDIGPVLIPLYPILVLVPVYKLVCRFKSRDVVVIFCIHGQGVEHAHSFFARETEMLPFLMERISQPSALATDSTTRASASRSG